MRESARIHAVRLTILLESTAALSSSSSIATDALHSQIHTQISQADLTALRTADASARRAPLLKLPHPIKDANVPFQIEHLRAGSVVLSSSPTLISSESRSSPTSHVRRPTLSSIGVLRGVLVLKCTAGASTPPSAARQTRKPHLAPPPRCPNPSLAPPPRASSPSAPPYSTSLASRSLFLPESRPLRPLASAQYATGTAASTANTSTLITADISYLMTEREIEE
ncbi:hypothetical protein C8J57DRAFT_1524019 [Mycena rebaudengoi]|nr:hypothetical protein C8J57DRAFT_1524019 [Mycena rebaudengoi]